MMMMVMMKMTRCEMIMDDDERMRMRNEDGKVYGDQKY